ncbi:MAG TPA: hypothetical protein VMU28_03400 [Terriglobales bacterium]|nr:hypothetical protein [Terriglobales bacterium]
MKRAAILPLLLLSALPLPAGKSAAVPLMKKPTQTAEIPNLGVPKPKQNCPNWAWAAAIQLMLAEQKIADFDQTYWVMKSAGGELCIEKPIDLDDLKQLVDGDYKLSDGGDIHLQGIITPGAPTDVIYFADQLKQGQTALLLWRGRPYLLQAIEYDEYIYPNGQRMFEARTLTLLDPLTRQAEVFEKTKDDPSELGGVFEVKVGPVNPSRY